MQRMMRSCKFCGIAEGGLDRRGKPAHINRDNLCAPCYYVLEHVKYQPEKLDAGTMDWFVAMCEFNMKHGMFVPIKQRKELAHLKPVSWACRRCGTNRITNQDFAYKNYCVVCAEEMRAERMERQKPRSAFKRRSDLGGTHVKAKSRI